MPPKRVGFLRRFGIWKLGLDFAHFSLESSVVYEGTTFSVLICSLFQFLMNKKEGIIFEFEMDFKKSFC